jgi:hypothetical protein
MHSTDTKSKFLELRAKDWSLVRISKEIDVSVRTHAEWNRQNREEIRTLRAIEIEAPQEKFLATHEQELGSLTDLLKRIDRELATRNVNSLQMTELFKLATATRAEIQKIVIDPQSDEQSKNTQN